MIIMQAFIKSMHYISCILSIPDITPRILVYNVDVPKFIVLYRLRVDFFPFFVNRFLPFNIEFLQIYQFQSRYRSFYYMEPNDFQI